MILKLKYRIRNIRFCRTQRNKELVPTPHWPSYRLTLCVIAMGAVIAANSMAQDNQLWVDKSGDYRVEATLIRFDESHVVLRKKNGVEIKVPLDVLADANRDYIKKLASARNKNRHPLSVTQIRKLGEVAPSMLAKLPTPYDRITAVANGTGDLKMRRQAVQQLEKIPLSVANECVVNVLHKIAFESDKAMRISALSALNRIDTDVSMPILFKCLDDDEFAVRWQACQLLRSINDPRMAKPLLERFDSRNRARISSILESLDADIEVPLQAFLAHPDTQVRVDAIVLMGKIGTTKSMGVLTKALEDKSRIVVLEARKAIKKIRSR